MTVNELRDLLAGYPGSAVVDISKAVSWESGSVTYRFGVFMDGTVETKEKEEAFMEIMSQLGTAGCGYAMIEKIRYDNQDFNDYANKM